MMTITWLCRYNWEDGSQLFGTRWRPFVAGPWFEMMDMFKSEEPSSASTSSFCSGSSTYLPKWAAKKGLELSPLYFLSSALFLVSSNPGLEKAPLIKLPVSGRGRKNTAGAVQSWYRIDQVETLALSGTELWEFPSNFPLPDVLYSLSQLTVHLSTCWLYNGL